MDITKEQKEQLCENVAAGVEWLNSYKPNWRSDIRTTVNEDSPLRMDICESCMIGRLIAEEGTEYWEAVECFADDEDPTDWEIDHGFDLPIRIFPMPGLAWRFLEDLWMEELCKEDSHVSLPKV